MFEPRSLGRREALGLLGGIGLTAALAACGSSSKQSSNATGSTSTSSGATGTSNAVTSCNLAPEVTEGPYYLTTHPETADLVQDRAGTPLALALTVVDANCEPIPGARVDVWHCDASGVYAGFESGQGENFLQGVQTADANGTVNFATIWPGYYQGRTVHIHLKVFVNDSDVHTGQLFFPDAMNAAVLADAPYGGVPDMVNDDDSIFRDAGSAALVTPTKRGSGYATSAQLVVSA